MKPSLSSRVSSVRSIAKAFEIGLMYELLDAHDDTSRLAFGLGEVDPAWRVHLDYLRVLQRKGREAVARLALEVK